MDQMHGLAVAIDDEDFNAVWVGPGGTGTTRRWPAARHRTLTDALLAYEAEVRVPLRGARCALAVMGTVQGETVRLPRCNWTLSRAGLRALFDREPLVVNDVAACAWAAMATGVGATGVGATGVGVAGAGSTEPLSLGALRPCFRRAGRWVVVAVDSGVGAAVIDVDHGGIARVLDGETGHCLFAAADGDERRLADAIWAVRRAPPSWETVLTLSPDDALWTAPGLPQARAGRTTMLARMMGRHVGETVMAHAAWSGALVVGDRAAKLLAGGGTAAFNAGFDDKAQFQRLFRSAPRWRLMGRDQALRGCAEALTRADAAAAPSGTGQATGGVPVSLRAA